MNRRSVVPRPPGETVPELNSSTIHRTAVSRTARTGKRGSDYSASRRLAVAGILSLFLVLLFALVAFLGARALNNNHDRGDLERPLRAASRSKKDPSSQVCKDRSYDDWRKLATEMASLPARAAIQRLEEDDPFGTRHFEERLTSEEQRLGRVLDFGEFKKLFGGACCGSDRITLPDRRRHDKSDYFRRGRPGTFLFFQHLRKAGGTHFCSLARANLPEQGVPKYYCMPDYKWSNFTGAGYLHHWNNAEIARRMKESGHRIAGNEWDNFDPSNHFDLPAVFATSFRRPLDRALSQFRFECIEDRGCKIKNVTKWWDRRKDLYNVYTITFADPPGPLRYKWLLEAYRDDGSSRQHAAKRADLIGRALDTVSRFDLVLVMEWLSYAGPQVRDVLGFKDTSVLTERVRPHIGQHQREDGQDTNALGASGITKASWDPKKYLDPVQYLTMSEDLALDFILTDAARRMFLERIACSD